MNSAIEVLKDFRFGGIKRKELISYSDSEDLPVLIHKDLREAIDKALLALEQKESLKEWLEKEIKENENWLNTTNDCLMPSEEEALEAEYKIKFCKEVLEKVGEQK